MNPLSTHPHRFTALLMLTVAGATSPTDAQIYSGYGVGGNQISSWFVNIDTGDRIDLQNPSAVAFATDHDRRRIYHIRGAGLGGGSVVFEDFAATGPVQPGAFTSLGLPRTQAGRELRRCRCLAFGNDRLYTSNRSLRASDPPSGLYEIDPLTAVATFLFEPQFRGDPLVLLGLAFDEDTGRLYGTSREGVTSTYSLFAIDLTTQTVERLVEGVRTSDDGVAYSDGRIYLIPRTGSQTHVIDVATGSLVGTVVNPPRGENGPAGGGTYADFLFPNVVPARQTPRVGEPANPDVLRPGVSGGPQLGTTWEPFVDHSTFLPEAASDTLLISATADNLPLPGFGTLLCAAPLAVLGTAAGSEFHVDIPGDLNLLGAGVCAQAVSLGTGQLLLTNALDLTIGSFRGF